MEIELDLVNKPSVRKNTDKAINDEIFPESNYNPRISRKLMEGVTGLSMSTLVKYEQEGIISPVKSKHGGLEVVTYGVEDISKILKKRGVTYNKRGKAEVIACFSQKGGTGKSSMTQHLGSMLSLVGKTLVIDLDSQGDAGILFGVDGSNSEIQSLSDKPEPTIAELMDWTLEDGSYVDYDRLEPEQVIKKLSPTLHIIKSDLDIAEINYNLNRLSLKKRQISDGQEVPGAMFLVKEVIDKISHLYDFILFDCPPNIETCNVAALFAANRIICPIELESKCLKVADRNESFLRKLTGLTKDLPADCQFSFDKILFVQNKYKKETIKIKATLALQDMYSDLKADLNISLSNMIIPSAAIIDRCAEAKEPIFVAATKFGKETKANIAQAKSFTDMFWYVMHEVLDIELDHFIFAKGDEIEDGGLSNG